MILFLDTETFSDVPINAGTHRYAERAEIMVESWAIDHGPVQVTDRTAGQAGPFAVYEPEDFDAIVMHNSMFDRIIYQYVDKLDIPVHLIHDTQVQARAHGLPGALDKLCAIFNVPEELSKHKDGKPLIQMFCKPQPKNQKLRRKTRDTHPVEWQRFLAYAGGDIHSMRHLYFNSLPRWNYPNREHPLWCLDQRINDRGFKVDLDLARAAIAMVRDVKSEVDEQTYIDTEGRVRSSTQRDALLEELLLEHGVTLPDMQATTIERRLEDPDLPQPVKDLLGQRLLTSMTSTAKYNKVLDATSPDGRLRGTITFCGAPRTKRDSGKLFQPQNLPRPDMPADEIEQGIATMKSGAALMMYDNDEAMRLAWNALRGLIVSDEGRKIVQGDLSQIEARILPWLAEQEWKLQAFRDFDAGAGPDLYLVGAARILQKSIDEITKALRQLYGKVPELACGYGGSVGAFQAMARGLGMELPELSEVHEIVRGWREANDQIANWTDGLWVRLEEAARMAIAAPGQVFNAGPYIAFERWRGWLKMHLPSGGFLSYASPHIGDHDHGGPNSICFWGINNYTRRWEKLYTYGGKLSADATQATARELFAHNWQHVEDQGFPIVLRVHDELVTEPLDDPNLSVQKLTEAMLRRPPWIDDKLPLAAGGFEAYRYRKDD
jgi:DNA polymerase